MYGSGKSIGEDMYRHGRSYTQMDGVNLEKQLDGLTKFLKSKRERDNMTPQQLISISNMSNTKQSTEACIAGM